MHEIFVNREVLDLLMFRFDKNNDGRITIEEVKIFFSNFSFMMKHIQEIKLKCEE